MAIDRRKVTGHQITSTIEACPNGLFGIEQRHNQGLLISPV